MTEINLAPAISGFYRLSLKCSAVKQHGAMVIAPKDCGISATIDSQSRCLAMRAAIAAGWIYSESKQMAYCAACAPSNPIKKRPGLYDR